MFNSIIILLTSTLLFFSVCTFAAEDSKNQSNIGNPMEPKPEQDAQPIHKDNVSNQQNYDKNDTGIEIQEEIDPRKVDPEQKK